MSEEERVEDLIWSRLVFLACGIGIVFLAGVITLVMFGWMLV